LVGKRYKERMKYAEDLKWNLKYAGMLIAQTLIAKYFQTTLLIQIGSAPQMGGMQIL